MEDFAHSVYSQFEAALVVCVVDVLDVVVCGDVLSTTFLIASLKTGDNGAFLDSWEGT